MAVDICITILKCVAYCSLKLYLLHIICLLPAKNVFTDVCLRLFCLGPWLFKETVLILLLLLLLLKIKRNQIKIKL